MAGRFVRHAGRTERHAGRLVPLHVRPSRHAGNSPIACPMRPHRGNKVASKAPVRRPQHHRCMASRNRRADEARRRWRRLAAEIGEDLRTARQLLGLTLLDVARETGVSASELSRRELGRSRSLIGEKLAVHAAAVGLRVSVKLWPVGGAIRDAAQSRYIAALLARVGSRWRVVLEAPLPEPGDLRAVDVLLLGDAARIAIEVITRLADLQAQLRAARLKAEAIGATRLIIVVAATRANRRTVADVRPTLVAAFDLDGRRVLDELAHGRDPGRDALVLLSAPPAR